MSQYLEDAGADGTHGQSGRKLPYVKPFVRNLDVDDTEGKFHFTSEVTGSFRHMGPS
jgi:hypothetical protein